MKNILLLISLLMSLCCTAQDDPDKKYATNLLKAGETAPEFVIANGDTLVGKTLSSFRGKFVVLDFWASWCPDCRKDIPALKKLHSTYSEKDVVFISISFDKDKDVWQRYILENNMPWIHHSELKPWKETGISNDYRIKWLPTMYLINTKGEVVLGTVDIKKLESALELIKSTTHNGIKSLSDSVIETRYPKGTEGLNKFIRNNLQYPEMAKAIKAEGDVFMHFTINPDGSISDITATECKISNYNKECLGKYPSEQQKDIYNECIRQFAKEGYRVIKNMKKWLPAPDNNAKQIKMHQRIKFTLL